MWFWKCATDIAVLKLSCGTKIVMILMFSFGCLGFPNQTWIDPDIRFKWQACACAHVHTQIQKWIKGSEIKTSNSLFHLACLEFFHLVFIPRAKLCISFCNQLAFNLFGTLSPLLSVRRWVIAAALHRAQRGVSQLRGHYLDSHWTAIFIIWARGRTFPQLTRSDAALSPAMIRLLWGDVANRRRLQACRCKISNMRWGRWVLFRGRGTGQSRSETICFESEHYFCFSNTVGSFWESRSSYLLLRLKLKPGI